MGICELLIEGTKIEICRTILYMIFQVSIKRLRGIQGKILIHVTFEEKRGSRNKRPPKVGVHVWNLIKDRS